MIDIANILDRHCAKVRVDVSSRKGMLEYASDLMAEHYDLPARTIFDELTNREKLGSTGLGEGVAIPHCRIPCSKIHAACLTLANPVEFNAVDEKPVDLVFILLVPPEENAAHLEILAELARLFGNADNRNDLRATETDDALFASQAA
jgi:PTS system nitrogen regulatory IIA component